MQKRCELMNIPRMKMPFWVCMIALNIWLENSWWRERTFAYYIRGCQALALLTCVHDNLEHLFFLFYLDLVRVAIFKLSAIFSNATFYDDVLYQRTTLQLAQVGLSSKDAVKSAHKYRTMYRAWRILQIYKKNWNECNETSKWLGGRCTIFNWIIIYVRFICILLLYHAKLPCNIQPEGALKNDEAFHKISLTAYHFQIEPCRLQLHMHSWEIIQFFYSFSKKL